MISIEPIDRLPDVEWGYETLHEIERVGLAAVSLIPISRHAVQIVDGSKVVLVAGVTRQSLLGGYPRLWCLVTKDFRPRHLRAIPLARQYLRQFAAIVVTPILGSSAAHRLALKWGFRPTGFKYSLFGFDAEDYILEV